MEKTIPNLNDKDRYIVHQKTLKQYLDLGLRIKKIHRGTSFEEEPWLKSYIELNTNYGRTRRMISRKNSSN